MIIPSKEYYYCPDCKKFHKYGGHSPVNRKLCFFCNKVQSKKTKIIGDMKVGHTQICEKCMKKHTYYE